MAARPFVTDDARLTTEGSCQLESWARVYPDHHEVWMLPACNPTGNLELTAGAGRDWRSGGISSNDYVLQLKTLFRTLKPNDWGIGLALGTVRHPSINPGPNALGSTYAYVPFSLALNDDKVVLHANLGWLKDKESQRHNAMWGVGGELVLNRHFSAIAEMYGDNRQAAFQQVGGRFALVPDKVQLDATWGRQAGAPAAGRWFSLGLRLTPESLF
jgi:hypothetical protein